MIKNFTLTLKNNFVKDFSIFTLHQILSTISEQIQSFLNKKGY
ncbi:hypothetical protein BSPLISOX_430 [uncultured Gammaproteobacteria bacterium]|nr:hypothetical protein [uncultured Gammaproteobacteria bacterium]CAC9444162.1 hypothetical protein [uncultured Gammaproteobacteria bacterium]VVH64585.1 hypothetical protein BSPLISOX_430 [uncultured Gammaproteobacteria bacterium]